MLVFLYQSALIITDQGRFCVPTIAGRAHPRPWPARACEAAGWRRPATEGERTYQESWSMALGISAL